MLGAAAVGRVEAEAVGVGFVCVFLVTIRIDVIFVLLFWFVDRVVIGGLAPFPLHGFVVVSAGNMWIASCKIETHKK